MILQAKIGLSIFAESARQTGSYFDPVGQPYGCGTDFSDIPLRSWGLLVRKCWIYYTVPTSEK